ncbi:hypothetical protein OCU04_003328 [Sclerotinia nivalis]|uniref:Uncharacterized protein n=1 Tax=Sclerotinia nivalis TaxID=352851 RepID=A0A9X0AV35_9HELO|nr:hypothetical protein OCU04_003328 [Sclerotinia nivalis]
MDVESDEWRRMNDKEETRDITLHFQYFTPNFQLPNFTPKLHPQTSLPNFTPKSTHNFTPNRLADTQLENLNSNSQKGIAYFRNVHCPALLKPFNSKKYNTITFQTKMSGFNNRRDPGGGGRRDRRENDDKNDGSNRSSSQINGGANFEFAGSVTSADYAD